MAQPLMPKATAVWLVENTSLTFEQIADFCLLHPLEVKGIADGEVAQGIRGLDPVAMGQLTTAEIDRCTNDPKAKLQILVSENPAPAARGKGPRYTPVTKRQDRPDAIAWLLRNHPELTDTQLCKLVGTTKPTIAQIRDRTHWNIQNIKPVDPVTLGLCSQIDLDEVVRKAADRKLKDELKRNVHKGPTLRTPAETLLRKGDVVGADAEANEGGTVAEEATASDDGAGIDTLDSPIDPALDDQEDDQALDPRAAAERLFR